ncbi:hypothetical protein ASE01_07575 [Nocardioides sp. Root190]|uniref:HNH endonuclease signature motif containing protein n=1 Tax=Nocardioides sp. Root190 TaxID=1736488 RepID=UPI0006F56FDF|nr:HNH endonuclease signature motif containing protein [Nocardioides sp. Root190]KRB78021.1 hypothetical protein ASE01_07575 [Nocardioides sp. Root190]
MNPPVLEDMSRTEVLDYAESRHVAKQQAERDLVAAAFQWAVLHHPDRAASVSKRVRDRAMPAGAVGTPLVTEYAASAFAARIQTSPYGAKKLIADAVDIHHRLPRLAAGLKAGTTRAGHARRVAEATRELTEAQAAWVDGEVHEIADGRLAWMRFLAVLDGKVAAASPELAQTKEHAAALERGIRMTRINKHGVATLTIRDHITTLMATDIAITAVAKELEARMPAVDLRDRKLAAFAMLTNPDAHLDLGVGPIKPKVRIDLHLTPDSEIVRMEDHGPVTIAWARQMIAHVAGKVTVLPVINLAHQAPVDAYEIPAAMREAVHLIHGGDIFPFAANTSRRVDLDHNLPYSEGGKTEAGNLGPMTRTHHRIKTHAGWECRQPFPGILVWRDPHGAHYLVDATGTRKLTTPPREPFRPRPDIYFTDVELIHDAA